MRELPELSNEEIRRYSRHLLLPEVGKAGQQRLKAARVLVVGAGGLGSPVLMYLAAAGIGHIGVVDSDVVDVSNLQRQIVHGTVTLGRPKVESARARLLDLGPNVQVTTYDEAFTSESAERIASGHDLIVDGTDNFPTRYLINDVCLKLGIPFVYGAVFRMEGQVSLFCTEGGTCYRCVFPDPPPPESVMTCAEAGVLGVVPGTIGTLQATEVIKHILGFGTPLADRLMIYSATEMQFESVALQRNADCPTCSIPPEKIELVDYHGFCGVPTEESEIDLPPEARITPKQLKQLLDGGAPIRILDVRQPLEWEIAHIEGSTLVPRDRLVAELPKLDRNEKLVIVCRVGRRSARVVTWLRESGFTRVRNLDGGLTAWSTDIDPQLPTY